MSTKSEPLDEPPNTDQVQDRTPSKTPMYTARNAQRYHRQMLIRDLEGQTKRKLLCFVSDQGAQISRDDTIGFVDMLHNISSGEDVDLLLHTPGGDIDAAEKLITLLHATVGEEGSLRNRCP
jgi:hypothetical protein